MDNDACRVKFVLVCAMSVSFSVLIKKENVVHLKNSVTVPCIS
jgi:hypothetical protein